MVQVIDTLYIYFETKIKELKVQATMNFIIIDPLITEYLSNNSIVENKGSKPNLYLKSNYQTN